MKNGARFILLLLLLVGVLPVAAQSESLTLEPLGTYSTGFFDEGGAEIVSYHAGTQQLFIINGGDNTVDIISIADPAAPELVSQLDLSEYGDGPTSVAVYEDIIASPSKAASGWARSRFTRPMARSSTLSKSATCRTWSSSPPMARRYSAPTKASRTTIIWTTLKARSASSTSAAVWRTPR